MEQVTGLPVLTIQMNRKEMARYGLNISDVQDVIEIAIGGKSAGKVFEGDRRFELLVRLPENMRSNIETLKRLPIPLPNVGADSNTGLLPAAYLEERKRPGYITLGSIAEFNIKPGPNQISRENGKRRVVVTANVRGRDIGSFVEEAERKIKERVTIPVNYWMTWGGQFEQMISARKRLQIVAPITLLLIFLFVVYYLWLYKRRHSGVYGCASCPYRGCCITLASRHSLSISAGVGFIALSGVAVLNGLVMISFINKLRTEGNRLDTAILQGSITRLRPVLMTALVASLGFLPMALATGTGAEVQRPLPRW